MADEKKAAADKAKYPAGPSFKEFLWNPETSQFLGRNLESWIKIVIFYIIFYICLAAFFGFCLYIFHLTLEDKSPKWTLKASLIGDNPGLGFRPMPDQDQNPESTLIWYQQAKTEDSLFWSNQLDKFINETYSKESESLIACDYNGTNKAESEKACRVDVSKFGIACSKNNDYGYPAGEPCIILKLNKIYGWKPEGYGIRNEKFNIDTLNEDIEKATKDGLPDNLKKFILEGVEKHKSNEENFLSTVWISCEGENPTDKENIGPLDFFPQPGIPGYFYPYMNQNGYQTPIIFAKLTRPVTGVLINIECKAWARNIHPNRLTRLGSVHFEILID